jgi:arginase family enzyme
MSNLRAKCPDCKAYTAVALGPTYECHACGREFAAGLVRVPRAWGEGGEAMEEAARLPLPYPETAVIAERTLGEQNLAIATDLPERPLVLGGCCCAHVGAVEALESRYGRIAVLWLDAHGDLNTVESSPTGNLWATPLRMLIDSAVVAAEDVVLVGARNLDPPEEEFIAAAGVNVGPGAVPTALDGTEGVYVAFDADSVDPRELEVFMPEPDGLMLEEVETIFRDISERSLVLGAGFTALAPDERNVAPVTRLATALSL